MPRSDPKPKKDINLAAAIRRVAKLHKMIGSTGKVTSEFVIEALRKRGQQAEADELEKLVTVIKARRRVPPK